MHLRLFAWHCEVFEERGKQDGTEVFRKFCILFVLIREKLVPIWSVCGRREASFSDKSI